MARRLRVIIGSIVLILLAGTSVASAEVFAACWVVNEQDRYGIQQRITRCRISGGSVVDYASDTSVPSVLYPQTGADTTGQCWYYTSVVNRFVILTQYGDGDAEIGFDTDPGSPGSIVAIGPRLPRCTSEPATTTDPLAEVWQYVTQYIHDPPTPDLNPRPGEGITGLDTYLGVEIPQDHEAQLTSGATTLDVFIEVVAVVVDWGDGTEPEVFPAFPPELPGYPDGYAFHLYEQKDSEGVQIDVSYEWQARWRVSGGAWELLAVPNTTTTVVYPLAEVVSQLTR